MGFVCKVRNKKMAVIVLILIGVVIWLIIGNDNQKPKNTTNHRQSKDDKEFEDMDNF